MRPKISICVAACNEQAKIRHALESARACPWCDELLVFDSGSSDNTVNIAREYADRVEFHEWVDYTTSKRRMTDAARNDWVFILDADEQITPELAMEIAHLDESIFRRHPVMSVPRKNYVLGHHVRCWDPDRIDRLFDKHRVHWRNRAIHDSRTPIEGSEHHLSAPLLHNLRYEDWSVYFDGKRFASRVDTLAREMFHRGRRVGFWTLWLRPWLTFLKYYLLKGGFTQGAFGLLIAQKSALTVQLKYARLWHLQQLEKRGLPLPPAARAIDQTAAHEPAPAAEPLPATADLTDDTAPV